MFDADDEDTSREELVDWMERWQTKDIVLGRLFSLYITNATDVARYVFNEHYTNKAKKQQLDAIASGKVDPVTGEYAYYADESSFFPTSVSSIILPPEGGWPGGMSAEEDVFTLGLAGFNGSFSNLSFSSYGNTTLHQDDNFSSPYMMPWPQRTSWIAVFTLLVVVAAVGNSLVAWIVFGQWTSLL